MLSTIKELNTTSQAFNYLITATNIQSLTILPDNSTND